MRCVLILISLLCLLGAAPETASRNIKISEQWVNQTSAPRAELHVLIANTELRADRLLRGSTPVAEKVAIYNQLGKEVGSFTIPGRAEFVIGADFPRIELIGLRRTLSAPASFRLLLVFEQAGKVSIDVLIKSSH